MSEMVVRLKVAVTFGTARRIIYVLGLYLMSPRLSALVKRFHIVTGHLAERAIALAKLADLLSLLWSPSTASPVSTKAFSLPIHEHQAAKRREAILVVYDDPNQTPVMCRR